MFGKCCLDLTIDLVKVALLCFCFFPEMHDLVVRYGQELPSMPLVVPG